MNEAGQALVGVLCAFGVVLTFIYYAGRRWP